ncbi:MAG: PCRF domain-containing protein, partial [Dehalococcoidia bacterium]
MALADRLAAIEARFEELTAEMGRPEIAADHERVQALARERASLEEVVELHRDYRDVDRAL